MDVIDISDGDLGGSPSGDAGRDNGENHVNSALARSPATSEDGHAGSRNEEQYFDSEAIEFPTSDRGNIDSASEGNDTSPVEAFSTPVRRCQCMYTKWDVEYYNLTPCRFYNSHQFRDVSRSGSSSQISEIRSTTSTPMRLASGSRSRRYSPFVSQGRRRMHPSPDISAPPSLHDFSTPN